MKLKILILSPIWGMLTLSQGIWGRPQQIALRLARDGHVILYLQGPIYLDRRAPALILSGNLFLRKRIASQLSAVNMFLPPFQGKLKFFADSLQVLILKLYLRSLRFKPEVAIFYGIEHVSILHTLRSMGTKILYDCVDELSGFSGVVDVARVLREEKDLVTNSSIVIVTSQALLQKLSKLNSNCYYVPNGADVTHFLKATKASEKIPEIDHLRHPIIGYIGHIADWCDVDLVCRLAELHPEYSVLIVGPVSARSGGLEKFKRHPNITLVGVKKYEVLPKYLAYMDVCLIPFKINRLTLAVNPVKLYEYLAAGKPVVSTALPEVCNNASEFVYVGKNREDFIRKVEEAVEEPKKPGYEAMVAGRVRFAEDNSWEKRIDVFERLLRQTLQSH
jgi:glycosyltransferase involved in cell wall biosynthesis